MDEVLALLPLSARHLAGLIGRDALLRLVAARGGTRVYVPLAWSADGELGQWLSQDEALPLLRAYGGEVLKIPLCPALKRIEAVRLHCEEGKSAAAVARQLGCAEDSVYRWVKDERALRAQADLFNQKGE